MNEAILLVEESFKLENFDSVVGSLNNIIFTCYTIGIDLGINLDRAFKLVHDSNMSKLCKTEKIAKKTVEWYKNQEESPYDSPDYKLSDDGNYYIVFNKSSGKILKSILYSPVDFTHFE